MQKSLKADVERARIKLRDARDCDTQTLAERQHVLTELATYEDMLEECAILKVDLAEIVAAIALARLLRSTQQDFRKRTEDAPERRRALTRLRVAKARAKARGDKTQAANRDVMRKHIGRSTADKSMLFLHAGLYKYLVREHGYLTSNRENRRRLDSLLLAILEKFQLGRTDDYESLRRYRRMLKRVRPGLFRHGTPSTPGPLRPSL